MAPLPPASWLQQRVGLGMGASVSVEAPDADELKRLFDKHDVTHSGHLERQEVPGRKVGMGWRRVRKVGSKFLQSPATVNPQMEMDTQ